MTEMYVRGAKLHCAIKAIQENVNKIRETYGNKISIRCTFVSYIYHDQKYLIKEQQKLNY
jgi:hypothetical protein